MSHIDRHVSWRLVGATIRIVALSLFVWHLATVSYGPLRHRPFGDSDTEAAVRAMNAGYPFQLLYPADANGHQRVLPMNEGAVDQGVALLMEFAALARARFTGARAVLDLSMGWTVVFGLLTVAAAAIVAPAVPLAVAVGGMLAFGVLRTSGPIGLGLPVHWGVAFAAVLAAVYVGTVLRPWNASRIVSLTLLAALIAVCQILRQEAAGVALGTGVALMISAGLAAFVVFRFANDQEDRGRLTIAAKRALAGGVLLILANSSIKPLERWCIARTTGAAYSETAAIEHGSGWPLYLSLGYVSNPFNIAWRDPIGEMHAILIDPDLRPGFSALHATLYREYLSIVVARPWLLIRNVAAKAVRIHGLATRRAERLPDVAVWQLPAHARLYAALPFVFICCGALIWWRGNPESVAVAVAFLGLAAAASAGALIVFPDYIGGVQGAIVVCALIAPATIGSFVFDRSVATKGSPVAARRMLACAGVMAAAAIALAGLFVSIQWMRYRTFREQIVERDPVDALQQLQFRYAHVFNDLPLSRQGRLVAQLLASTDPRVDRIVDERRGDSELFRPEAVVLTTNQLHVVVWMGSAFQAPVPPLYQGTTHSLIFVCGDCGPDATVNNFPYTSTMVNDLEWRGRYRIYSLPLTEQVRRASFFRVVGERVLAVGAQYEPRTGILPGLIASVRIAH